MAVLARRHARRRGHGDLARANKTETKPFFHKGSFLSAQTLVLAPIIADFWRSYF
jgi:hypothetical protein